jgi:phosphoribosylaminoimidazole (AIR) synthetase
MLPAGARLALQIDLSSWTPPALFRLAAQLGNLDPVEQRRTFNMGVGMVVAVDAAHEAEARALLEAEGETVWRIGQVAPADAPDAPVEFLG